MFLLSVSITQHYCLNNGQITKHFHFDIFKQDWACYVLKCTVIKYSRGQVICFDNVTIDLVLEKTAVKAGPKAGNSCANKINA